MLMTQEQALQCAQQMYTDSGHKDLELGAAQVIRDLIQLAHNNTSPLVQVEAIEVLMALDPEGWKQGTQHEQQTQKK